MNREENLGSIPSTELPAPALDPSVLNERLEAVFETFLRVELLTEKIARGGQLLQPKTRVQVQSEEHQDKEGEILSFVPLSRTYKVKLVESEGEADTEEESICNVEPEDIYVKAEVSVDEQQCATNAFIDARLSPVEQVKALLSPGTLLKGEIVIPGLSEVAEGPADYEVAVLPRASDEEGRELIVVQHSAYGDTQICELKLWEGSEKPTPLETSRGTPLESQDLEVEPSSKKAATEAEKAQQSGKQVPATQSTVTSRAVVNIEYMDSETCCRGSVDVDRHTMCGRVTQLVQGEEGFFYNSQEVTHTFRLNIQKESDEVKLHRCNLVQAKRDRLAKLADLESMFSSRQLVTQQLSEDRLEMLMRLNWQEMFSDIRVFCEEVCFRFRRHKELLDNLRFKDVAEKKTRLQTLRGKGISRHQAHKVYDEVTAICTSLLVYSNRLTFFLLTNNLQKRLAHNYDIFDKALRRAEDRIPETVYQAWKGTGDGSTSCTICVCPIEDGEVNITLPCSHVFHFNCMESWIHHHPSCPLCRQSLAQSDD